MLNSALSSMLVLGLFPTDGRRAASLGGLGAAGRQGGVGWGSRRQRAAIERVERLCGGVSVVTGTNGNIEVVSPTFFFVYASILDATVPSGEMMREANNYERVFAGGSRRSAKKGRQTQVLLGG